MMRLFVIGAGKRVKKLIAIDNAKRLVLRA